MNTKTEAEIEAEEAATVRRNAGRPAFPTEAYDAMGFSKREFALIAVTQALIAAHGTNAMEIDSARIMKINGLADAITRDLANFFGGM